MIEEEREGKQQMRRDFSKAMVAKEQALELLAKEAEAERRAEG